MRFKIALLLVAVGLSAQGMGPGNGPGNDDRDPNSRPALERLGLNEAQITAVTDIWTRRLAATRQTRADLEVKQAEIGRALVPANPDMNVVRRLLRESVDLEYQLRLNMMEGELEVRKAVGEEIWVRMVRGRDRSMMSMPRRPADGPMMQGPRDDDRPGRR